MGWVTISWFFTPAIIEKSQLGERLGSFCFLIRYKSKKKITWLGAQVALFSLTLTILEKYNLERGSGRHEMYHRHSIVDLMDCFRYSLVRLSAAKKNRQLLTRFRLVFIFYLLPFTSNQLTPTPINIKCKKNET